MVPVIFMGLGEQIGGAIKDIYEGGKPQRGGPSFLGGVDLSRHHVLKNKNLAFPGYFTSPYRELFKV